MFWFGIFGNRVLNEKMFVYIQICSQHLAFYNSVYFKTEAEVESSKRFSARFFFQCQMFLKVFVIHIFFRIVSVYVRTLQLKAFPNVNSVYIKKIVLSGSE